MKLPKLTWGLKEIKLEYGYFYRIHRLNESDDEVSYIDAPRNSWITSNRPGYDPDDVGGIDEEGVDHPAYGIIDYYTWAESLDDDKDKYQEKNIHSCSKDKSHITRIETTKIACEIFGGSKTLPKVIPEGYACFFINGVLAKQIEKSGLTGFKLLKTERFFHSDKEGELNYRKGIPFQVYLLESTVKSAYQAPVIEPVHANKCPFCGFIPLICPECGDIQSPCQKCNKYWIKQIYESDLLPEEQMKYKDQHGLIEYSKGYKPSLEFINPHKWDGFDFFGDCVTLRTVNWLLSVNAAPFKAEPVAVNIAGLKEKQLRRLQAAKEPLPQIKKKSNTASSAKKK